MKQYAQTYIDGSWQGFDPLASLDLKDSFTEQPFAHVALAGAAQVQLAVAAARRAFDGWSGTPLEQRAQFLRRIGANLAKQAEPLAEQITREVGMPLKLSRRIQVNAPAGAWESYAQLAGQMEYASQIGHSLVTQEPVGIVACITPWNYPLHQMTAKVAPALAAGCVVVLKPSELAPAAAYALAQAVHESGLPPGVFNLVVGAGNVAGEALAAHPDVDMVSFTGSTAAGKRVAGIAADGVKRVALELGGKSASIVLPGADLALAMRHALGACFLNSGQTCTAITRLLVPADRYDECARLLQEGAASFAMGDPMESGTRLGPLVSGQQRDRVQDYIAQALAAGATSITSRAILPPHGYFVAPTVLGGVHPDSAIAQEEVFGPVLAVIAYQSEEEAIAIANHSNYGLAAAVWGADRGHALAVAKRLRAGQIDINGAAFNPLAPFGGFKHSGVGRENGAFGIKEFLEPRAIQLPA